MRSEVLQKILDETPDDVKIFVDKYTDLVILINQLLHEKGYTQKSLALLVNCLQYLRKKSKKQFSQVKKMILMK